MDRVKALLARKEPVVWLFAGDSITHGAAHTFGWRDYTELFRERVAWELQRMDDAVINTAYSGYNTRGLLEQYELRVARFKPDVVFIMIGMNDCCQETVPLAEFKRNLHELACRIQEAGGLPIMQTTCPVISGKAPGREEYLPAYMDAIRQTSAEMQLPMVDHYADYQNRGEQTCYYLMSDPFHPNELRHRAFMHLICKELGIWNDSSYVCRLLVP